MQPSIQTFYTRGSENRSAIYALTCGLNKANIRSKQSSGKVWSNKKTSTFYYCAKYTAQKMKISVKDFFKKCEQIRIFSADLFTYIKKIQKRKTFCTVIVRTIWFYMASVFLLSDWMRRAEYWPYGNVRFEVWTLW